MCKKNFGNAALYMLFFVNCIYAAQNGLSWLFYVASALTAVVLIMDIAAAVKNAGKK